MHTLNMHVAIYLNNSVEKFSILVLFDIINTPVPNQDFPYFFIITYVMFWALLLLMNSQHVQRNAKSGISL